LFLSYDPISLDIITDVGSACYCINPDIDWSTKTIRTRKTGEAMVSGDQYTVPVTAHHLEADAMAKMLRQQPAYLFVIDPLCD
jgi:hypothetical protein